MNRFGETSTRNKCERKIVNSELKDNHSYMNTVPLSPKNAFKSPYYEKGKIKFLMEYGKDLKETNQLDKNNLVDEIDEMITHEKIKQSNHYFKAITTKPIVAEKTINLFEENYPLE